MRVYHFLVPTNGTKVRLEDWDGRPYTKIVQEAGGIDKDFIYVVTQKTRDAIPINLNSYSRAILEKYRDGKFKADKAQAMNRFDKSLEDQDKLYPDVQDIES